MTRIFSVLAMLAGLALVVTFVLGLTQLVESMPAVWHWLGPGSPVHWHIVAGLFTAVFVLLVHCLVFTYLLGTGRWVKEVSQAYAIAETDGIAATRRLKARSYPAAMLAMFMVIVTVGSGAAIHTEPGSWIGLSHPILSVLCLLFNGWAFIRELRVIGENQVMLDRIMASVRMKQSAAQPV